MVSPGSARRARAAALVVTTAAALIAIAGACQFIVSDNVPGFSCLPTGTEPPCLDNQVCARPPTESGYRCIPPCAGRGPLTICAAGYSCNPDSGICDPVPEASTAADEGGVTDAGAETPGDGMVDQKAFGDGSASTDSGLGCRGFGCRCASVLDCIAGFTCVDRQALTGPIWDMFGDAAPPPDAGSGLCVEPCCTSRDCEYSVADGGAVDARVCFAAGTGGDYCVPAGWLGRSGFAVDKAGGAPCGGDAGGCRSGLCLDSGVCADTCCDTKSSSQCATSAGYCHFSPFPGTGFDTHVAANCTAPANAGPAAGGAQCMSNMDCRSDLCLMGRCSDACRNRDNCQTSGAGATRSQTCDYMLSTAGPAAPEVIAACMPLMTGIGPGPGPGSGGTIAGDGGDGTACRIATDCAHGYCATVPGMMAPGGPMGVCLAVCFSDDNMGSNSDCPPGERCRPQSVLLGGVTYSVLACGND